MYKLLLLGSVLCALPAAAQQSITMAAQSAPTAMDPHFHRANPNNGVLRQFFDGLIDYDTKGRIVPRLAETWRVVDDTTWEFRLREGVRFHDGTPLRIEDVAFSFARLPNVPNSPGSFASAVRTVKEVKAIDERTLRITTTQPTPYLDGDLTAVLILSRQLHENATTSDFNAGRAAIGTGAYRLVSYELNTRLIAERNPGFWGAPEPWQRVDMRFVPSPASRVASLLAGDVDLIDGVPTQDVARLAADPRIGVYGTDSNGTAYLFPDAVRDQAPFITDKQGRPLATNPLKDVRVRRALSMAIPRQAIVERLLSGQATPAEQFAAPIATGRVTDMPPIPYDIVGAKALLVEAGYADGFRMTIHGPTGWFPGDQEVLQAIAQGFSRIGVETQVQTLPTANYFSRATNREFAMFMSTYADNIAAFSLQQVVATRDPATQMGPFNRQHYSNPAVDRPLAAALRTMDTAKRNAFVAEAMRATVDDLGVIPLLYLKVNWAGVKAKVTYDASPGWYTNALFARPAN